MKLLVWMLIVGCGVTANASTSRVGNGDDGRDLEGLSKIESGPIFESRLKAVENLKKLNVQGIPGLGALIPEVEKTELLMSNRDVKSLETEGEWETSKRRQLVYARTFAEPHSPTRFFPISKTLNEEQLIALHTHEALHRALPPGVRENEDKVAMLTLALTSPYATFDRVNRVVQKALWPDEDSNRVNRTASSSSNSSKLVIKRDPEAWVSPAELEYEFSSFDNSGGTVYKNGIFETEEFRQNGDFFVAPVGSQIHSMSGEFSPIGVLRFGEKMLEPRLQLKGYAFEAFGNYVFGPISLRSFFEIEGEGAEYGPQLRVSLRSIDGDYINFLAADRDVYSLGWLYKKSTYRFEHRFDANYSFSSESANGIDYGGIWSASMQSGWKKRKLLLSGGIQLANMQSGDLGPQTIISVGPEVAYRGERYGISISGHTIINQSTNSSVSNLGDLDGQGMGTSRFSLALSAKL